MKLEVGKQYETRAGYKVWCIWRQPVGRGHTGGDIASVRSIDVFHYLVIHEDVAESKFKPLMFRPPFVHSECGRVLFRFGSYTGLSADIDRGWDPYKIPYLLPMMSNNPDENHLAGPKQNEWYKNHKPEFAEDIVEEWKE